MFGSVICLNFEFTSLLISEAVYFPNPDFT